MRAILVLLVFVASLGGMPVRADEPVIGKPYDFMAGYRDGCHDKIYASCLDQSKLLNGGLRQAKGEHKLAVVILGFNSCPPCNVLDTWLKSPKGMELMSSYVQIELSIFDPAGALRPEVFDAILPGLKLGINKTPPYGVPLFAIVDPDSKAVVGKSLMGFDAKDQSAYIAYLTASAKAHSPSQ